MSYLHFAAMIATSTVVMFALMYLNTIALDHVRDDAPDLPSDRDRGEASAS